MPSTATRSPGRAGLRRNPLYVVTPAQAIGPASVAARASGIRASASTGAITCSAKPPS